MSKKKAGRFRRKLRRLRKHPLNLWYYRTFKGGRTFTVDGKEYPYFYHRYMFTWLNERTVEVPFVKNRIDRYPEGRILEIGNVLSHYYDFEHAIVDKYDRSPGVINADVVDYSANEPYDLIVSISTLEHVGYEEEVKDPRKPVAGVDNLRKLLNPGGGLVVTLPLGYNPHIDELVGENELGFERQVFLKRTSRDNLWKQVGWEDVAGIQYGLPYRYANGLVIGMTGNV